jgi:hypothetical protein
MGKNSRFKGGRGKRIEGEKIKGKEGTMSPDGDVIGETSLFVKSF